MHTDVLYISNAAVAFNFTEVPDTAAESTILTLTVITLMMKCHVIQNPYALRLLKEESFLR